MHKVPLTITLDPAYNKQLANTRRFLYQDSESNIENIWVQWKPTYNEQFLLTRGKRDQVYKFFDCTCTNENECVCVLVRFWIRRLIHTGIACGLIPSTEISATLLQMYHRHVHDPRFQCKSKRMSSVWMRPKSQFIPNRKRKLSLKFEVWRTIIYESTEKRTQPSRTYSKVSHHYLR